MPNTPEHKAEMYSLAQGRRRSGLPSWKYQLDLAEIFVGVSKLSFAEKRDETVRRIRASSWFRACRLQAKRENYLSAIEELADEMSEVDGTDEFDYVMNAIYDQADYDRCWIKG